MKRRINYTQSDFDAAVRYLLKHNPATASITFDTLMRCMKSCMFDLIKDDAIDSIATFGFVLIKSVDSKYIDIDVYVSPQFKGAE